jgi:transposase
MKPEMSILGIDIAKRVFHVVGMDERGKIVLRKRLSRHALIPFIATLPPVLIGMEAWGGAHYWARRFRAHGHEVKRARSQLSGRHVQERRATAEGKMGADNKTRIIDDVPKLMSNEKEHQGDEFGFDLSGYR